MNRANHRIFLIASGFLLAVTSLVSCAAPGSQTPGRDQALDPVKATAVSPDGRTFAVYTVTSEVALFDAVPLRFRRLLTPEGSKIQLRGKGADYIMQAMNREPPFAFSPSGELLVAKVAGEIIGWEVGSGSVKFRAPAEEGMLGLAFIPDGRSFVTVGHAVRQQSAESGSMLGEFRVPTNARATSVAVSPEGTEILVGLASGEIAELDTRTGQVLRVLKGHLAPVTSITFSPDGSAFATNGGRFDPRIWNRDESSSGSRRLSELTGSEKALRSTVRSTEALGLLALLGSSRGFGGMPGTSGILENAPRQSSPFFCDPKISYSPDGRFVAATAHLSTLSGEFHVLLADLERRQGRVISGLTGGCSAAFTRDSKFLLTGGYGSPQVWNVETGARVDVGK